MGKCVRCRRRRAYACPQLLSVMPFPEARPGRVLLRAVRGRVLCTPVGVYAVLLLLDGSSRGCGRRDAGCETAVYCAPARDASWHGIVKNRGIWGLREHAESRSLLRLAIYCSFPGPPLPPRPARSACCILTPNAAASSNARSIYVHLPTLRRIFLFRFRSPACVPGRHVRGVRSRCRRAPVVLLFGIGARRLSICICVSCFPKRPRCARRVRIPEHAVGNSECCKVSFRRASHDVS